MNVTQARRANADDLSSDRITPIRFSTRNLPQRNQFEAWRSFVAPVIDMDIADSRNHAFEADQTVWDVGSFALTRATLPGDGRFRTWQHLRKNALDHWCFVIVNEGATATTPGSRDLYFRSLGQRFDGAANDTDVLSLYVPRDLFGDGLSNIDGHVGEVPNSGIGALLADYFISLEARLPYIPCAELPQVIEATRAMIGACIRPTAARIEVAQDAIVATLMERSRTIVRQNLNSTAFGPEQLGRALGVSRSRLYRLFEPFGGVARYLHRQRLLAAHAALSDPSNVSPIVLVAESCGFVDASGFSRSFRQEFGYSPRDARAAASLGAPKPVRPPRPGEGAVTDLGEVLRRLRA